MINLFNKKNPIVQTDFTTIMGAANALNLAEIKKNGFTLTSLLNLSQFIETFVLNSKIQFEYGQSKEWESYRLAFETKELGQFILSEKDTFKKTEVQIDENEEIVISVIKEIISEELDSLKLKCLDYAIKFRNGTYSAIHNIQDQSNPVIERYIKIAKDNFNLEENNRLENYIQKLKNGNVGILGLFVQARIKLIQRSLKSDFKIYNPHFSRQPLISNELQMEIHSWNMEQLSRIRTEMIEPIDELGKELSPVFLACLSKAKYPIDILENAINLRNSSFAKQYRELCDLITLDVMKGDATNLVLYKANLKNALKDFNETILNNNVTEVHKSQIEFRFNVVPVTGKYIIEHSEKISKGIGTKNYTMFSNVLQNSISIVDTLKKLNDIYKQDFIFDTVILTGFGRKK